MSAQLFQEDLLIKLVDRVVPVEDCISPASESDDRIESPSISSFISENGEGFTQLNYGNVNLRSTDYLMALVWKRQIVTKTGFGKLIRLN